MCSVTHQRAQQPKPTSFQPTSLSTRRYRRKNQEMTNLLKANTLNCFTAPPMTLSSHPLNRMNATTSSPTPYNPTMASHTSKYNTASRNHDHSDHQLLLLATPWSSNAASATATHVTDLPRRFIFTHPRQTSALAQTDFQNHTPRLDSGLTLVSERGETHFRGVQARSLCTIPS